MEQIDENRIAVVIVVYNPKKEDIDSLYHLSSIYKGIIVDNSINTITDDSMIGKMYYIANHENKGIAEAQNIAIKKLIDDNSCDFVVFLDQDSRLPDNYAKNIVNEYIKAILSGFNLSILGPTIVNQSTGKIYDSAVNKDVNINDFLLQHSFVISSGSCISISTLKKVGLNDASLFIDYVDSEWCWRSQSFGYICAVTKNISISHSVGRKLISFGPLRDIVSAPIRYYYQFRNYIWLCKRSYVPSKWKIRTFIKFMLRIIYVPFIRPDGLKSWQFIWKGIYDGLKGK